MLKRKKAIIAKVMATTLLASTLATTYSSAATVSSTTLAGANRYQTAIEISKNGWYSASNAVLINGEKGLVDALTATPYASLKNAPILVTGKDTLHPDTKTRLTQMGVKNVDIVGGTSVVSETVVTQLKAMGITVNRISGINRYETATAVAKAMDAISDVSQVAVVNGLKGLPDAVSVAAPAADNKMPILLADPNSGLNSSAKDFINGESVYKSYVIGQTAAVSDGVMNSLPGTKVRLGGSNRQDTNAEVIRAFYPQSSLDNIYVAKSGQVNREDELVDALAVGVLAAKNDDPVMIVGKGLTSDQDNLLRGKTFSRVTQVGQGVPSASIEAIKNTQNSIKEVTSVSALNSALSSARSGDVINFRPSSTVSENISLSTSADVTVNLYGTYNGIINCSMSEGNLNISGNVNNTVNVNGAKTLSINSGITVKDISIKSTAKNTSITNQGKVTTLTVLTSGVRINNTGAITTLNRYGDTVVTGSGTIGNIDSSKPIASISSLNAKQILIVFNKAMDKDTVIDRDGYLVQDTGVNRVKFSTTATALANQIPNDAKCIAELDESGTLLTVTAPTGKYFEGNYTIEVQNIKSAGITQDKHVATLNIKDTDAPTVSSVEFDASINKFKVKLSEPVKSKNSLVLVVNNNISVDLSTVALNTIQNEFTFGIPSGVNYGDKIKVYIDGLEDGAGNMMRAYSKDSISVSNTILTATYKQTSNNKLRITFNKEIPTDISSKISVVGTGVVGSATKVAGDNKSYDITLTTANYSTTNKLAFKVNIASGVVDVTGTTTTKPIEINVSLTKDVTGPKISSTKANSDNTGLEITLSEDIKESSITNSKIKLYKGSGVSISGTDATLKSGTTNVITVEGLSTLAEGTYHVKFEAGAIQDNNSNNNLLMSTDSVTVKNTVSTTYSVTSIDNDAYDNSFIITYTGEIDDEKVSYENFYINNEQIKETSTITLDAANKTIKVKLPSSDGINIEGNATLKASRLTLKAGQILADKSSVVTVVDNTAPTLETATLYKSKNQLVLKFDENIILSKADLTLSEILTAVEIKYGKTPIVYDMKEDVADIEVNGKVVTITITPHATNSVWSTVKDGTSSTNPVKVSIKKKQIIMKDAAETPNNAREVLDKVVSKNS
ncbi:cell wall-binding repeat-containing protein [Romboutsia sp.]|uniref:cell wall-binding repeat-containing protein n=1 Tax=Romboutsia sp. TaxID=1965302 RepID=UPI003F376353